MRNSGARPRSPPRSCCRPAATRTRRPSPRTTGSCAQRQTQTQATGRRPGAHRHRATTRAALVAWTSGGYYDIANAAADTTWSPPPARRSRRSDPTTSTTAPAGRPPRSSWPTASRSGAPPPATAATGPPSPRRPAAPPPTTHHRRPRPHHRAAPVHTAARQPTGELTTPPATPTPDRGELATVTDPAGNVWTLRLRPARPARSRGRGPGQGHHHVDLRRRRPAGHRPPTRRGTTLAYTYDELGRKTSLRDGTVDRHQAGRVGLRHPAQRQRASSTSSTRYERRQRRTSPRSPATTPPAGPPAPRSTIPATEGALCAASGPTPCSYTHRRRTGPTGSRHHDPAGRGRPARRRSSPSATTTSAHRPR